MRGGLRALLLGALAVTLGYQVQRPVSIPAGSGVLGAALFRDFWGSEGNFRWSRDRSVLVFPDPGPGVEARVLLSLSAWRPRGQEPPLVTVEAGPAALTARVSPRGEELVLRTVTSGWWRSDLAVRIESETFTPGPKDPRALGVRVYGARLVPEGPLVAARRPPLGQVVTMAISLLLLFALLRRVGVPEAAALRSVATLALVAAVAYAVARPYAVLASLTGLVTAAVLAALAYLAPAAAATVAVVLAESVRGLARGLRGLATPTMAGLLVAGGLGIAWTYRTRASLDFDLGSGREAAVASGFGAFDSNAGATFRPVLRTAELDLRDFGSGPWTIQVRASVGGSAPRNVEIAAGQERMRVTLGGDWFTAPMDSAARFGWRSGLVIHFLGGSDAAPFRVDRVRIHRPRSLPPLRVLTAALGTALLLAAGLGAAGVSRRAGSAAATVMLGGETAALLVDPAIAVPFVVPFFGVAAAGAGLMVLAAGVCQVAARRGATLVPPPTALAAAGIGFMAWLAATAFPLYGGGLFNMHSSISEEIWKGRFLVYYLPYPGSMLSPQAHWGNIIVPHPCLEQTLLAPLAALPQPWFHLAEKVVLALWLSSMALMAALLAARVAGVRAGAFAAAVAACSVPTFQLLGLGHLMTIFGCWASSLAFTLLILRLDRLAERRTWWTAVGLLTLCFLSYFASLLFAGLALVLFMPFLFRREPAQARALLAAVVAAGALAFGLYYVHWAWPFLSETIPKILSGASSTAEEAGTILRRLARQPHKLAYSYGTLLVPLVAFAGLLSRVRSREGLLLLAWASVLPVVSGLDLFFNFLLKHHYFVMVPMAVGAGLVLARLAERGRSGRVAAAVLVGLAGLLGAETGLAVALGRIP